MSKTKPANKKWLLSLFLTAIVSSVALTAYAAASTSFTVNNASCSGALSYVDSTGGSPFDSDSVTAKTSSSSAMDTIYAQATLYYKDGSTAKTVSASQTNTTATSVSATASKYTSATGYKGEGSHSATHAGRSGSGSTNVSW